MVSNKKSRSRKKYQYHVDRKKVHKKSKKQPNIKCEAIKKEWKNKLSASKNLKVMGLVYDTNKSIPIATNRPEISETDNKEPTKVVTELVKESNAPRNGTIRIPKEKVKWIEYLLDKYGEDYEAMALDKNNHYQETAAQLKQKIKQFKKRPAYLVTYLQSRKILPTPIKNKTADVNRD
nr:EOG090X0IKC [Eurycercus lamellatus]